MCGIVGIVAHEDVNQNLYDALTVLQHRGDAAGIMTRAEDKVHKNQMGWFTTFFVKTMRRPVGPMGIGHVRYPTAGCNSSAESQPFYVNSPMELLSPIMVISQIQTNWKKSYTSPT